MKNQNITASELQASKLITDQAKIWASANFDYLNRPMTLLGSSTKVEKGEKLGFYTNILYLIPAAQIAKKTLCAGAKMAGCLSGCLINSGQLRMPVGQNAATKRTILYTLRKASFIDSLIKEIAAKYKRYGDKLAVRLNGTSDIDFSQVYNALPKVRFYEYSKIIKMVENAPSNVHYTFSGSAYSPASIRATKSAIKQGLSVALAFNTKNKKSDNFIIPSVMVDFDNTDLRFLDSIGTIGALKRKGGNIKQRLAEYKKPSFFFTDETISQVFA